MNESNHSIQSIQKELTKNNVQYEGDKLSMSGQSYMYDEIQYKHVKPPRNSCIQKKKPINHLTSQNLQKQQL